MGVGEKAAMTLALAIHELATNSLKYGSLSAAEGTLDVSCVDQDMDIALNWTERGGPAVTPPEGAAVSEQADQKQRAPTARRIIGLRLGRRRRGL